MSNEKDLETINGKPLHPGVKELCAQFGDGKMDRREFVRLAAFLGVSAASAYAFAGDPLGGALVQKAAAQAPKKGGVLRVAMQVQEMKRSEEHTSELQSLMRISYAVFCLKKKKKTSL